MSKIFSCQENSDFFTISIDSELFVGGEYGGSFNIIASRILGLSYPNYLRYLRDTFSAELRGKKGYPYPIFKERQSCMKVINILNKNWQIVETEIGKLELGNTPIKTLSINKNKFNCKVLEENLYA